MTKPRVLHISVRSDIGGGPKHVLDLTSSFKSEAITTYLAAPLNGEYAEKLKENNSQFYSLPFRKFSIFRFLFLVKICKSEKISIIHSHGRGAGTYSRLMKFFGFKVVHTFHGVHLEKTFIGKLKLLVDKLFVPLTDRFICVSNSEKDNAVKNNIANERKTTVIYNGVSLPDQAILPTNKLLNIGTLSRLNYQKGIEILIEFLTRFEKETGMDFVCNIAGDGELKDELHSLERSSQIKFLGNVEPQQFLRSIDLYISFARWEGLPIAVLEAMSNAKVCLLSDVEGNNDLIRNGENGFLFDLKNYEDFKIKLLNINNAQETELKEIGERAKEDIVNLYSIESMSDKTLEVYKNLLNNSIK